MLVKMFLCFYLNVPLWSFNLIHLSYDENKVEPVAGDLQSLEGMDLLFLKSDIVCGHRSSVRPEPGPGVWNWVVFLRLQAAFLLPGPLWGDPRPALCALGFLSCFTYKPFFTVNSGFVVVERVWLWFWYLSGELHGLGQVTLHLWTSMFSSMNLELGDSPLMTSRSVILNL